MKNVLEWLNVQLEWFKEFFSEYDAKSGKMKASSKRLMSFFTVVALVGSHAKIAIKNLAVTEIPYNNALLIAALIGIITIGNFWNGKKTEKE